MEKKYIEHLFLENKYKLDDYDYDYLLLFNMFKNNILFEPKNGHESNIIGLYFRHIKNYTQMKKYYRMAIRQNNATAMVNLGGYYQTIEQNYRKMKKYYRMAIKRHNATAMVNLGYYYEIIEKDYDSMKKYYRMAIEHKSSTSIEGLCIAMNNLGVYHQDIEKDYESMKKYYLMAIELNHVGSIENLGAYYENKENKYTVEDKLNFAIKYKNDLIVPTLNELEELTPSILDLLLELPDEILQNINSVFIKYAIKLLNEKIDLMDLHFNYSMQGKGFTEAKSDFYTRMRVAACELRPHDPPK